MTQNGVWYMVYLCGRQLEGKYSMLVRETEAWLSSDIG